MHLYITLRQFDVFRYGEDTAVLGLDAAAVLRETRRYNGVAHAHCTRAN